MMTSQFPQIQRYSAIRTPHMYIVHTYEHLRFLQRKVGQGLTIDANFKQAKLKSLLKKSHYPCLFKRQ